MEKGAIYPKAIKGAIRLETRGHPVGLGLYQYPFCVKGLEQPMIESIGQLGLGKTREWEFQKSS